MGGAFQIKRAQAAGGCATDARAPQRRAVTSITEVLKYVGLLTRKFTHSYSHPSYTPRHHGKQPEKDE